MFRRPFVWIGVLLVAVLGLTFFVASQSPAQAQPGRDTMADLLDELWNRVLAEQTSPTTSSFTFTVSFTESISGGIGNRLTFGQGLNNQQLSRIGADYFCVSRAFSRTLNVDCIPFVSISNITYQEPATQ